MLNDPASTQKICSIIFSKRRSCLSCVDSDYWNIGGLCAVEDSETSCLFYLCVKYFNKTQYILCTLHFLNGYILIFS